ARDDVRSTGRARPAERLQSGDRRARQRRTGELAGAEHRARNGRRNQDHTRARCGGDRRGGVDDDVTRAAADGGADVEAYAPARRGGITDAAAKDADRRVVIARDTDRDPVGLVDGGDVRDRDGGGVVPRDGGARLVTGGWRGGGARNAAR